MMAINKFDRKKDPATIVFRVSFLIAVTSFVTINRLVDSNVFVNGFIGVVFPPICHVKSDCCVVALLQPFYRRHCPSVSSRSQPQQLKRKSISGTSIGCSQDPTIPITHTALSELEKEASLKTNMQVGKNRSLTINQLVSSEGSSFPSLKSQYSLGGQFLIIANHTNNESKYEWLLIPIDDEAVFSAIVPDSYKHSEGSIAWAFLHCFCHSNNNNSVISIHDNRIHNIIRREDIVTKIIHLNTRIKVPTGKKTHDGHNNESIEIQVTASPYNYDNTKNQQQTQQHQELIAILSRTMVQWAAMQYQQELRRHEEGTNDVDSEQNRNENECRNVVIHFGHSDGADKKYPNEIIYLESLSALLLGQIYAASDDKNGRRAAIKTLSKLYHPWFDDITQSTEIVEMVDRDGISLGCIPRKLVHEYNLLHRGIGIFVTRNEPMNIDGIEQLRQQQPDLFTHQRSDNKRIFPSLYDMFVGGVSLAGEDSIVTAKREVAEELGLIAAFNSDDVNDSDKLFGPILHCVVCTGYNRCFVELYCYTMDTLNESIELQDEEVQWGSFVPYDIICGAADLSIQRLHRNNQWPGSNPPIQSKLNGTLDSNDCGSGLLPQHTTDYNRWDFVPDGLLVWEAWLQRSEGGKNLVQEKPMRKRN